MSLRTGSAAQHSVLDNNHHSVSNKESQRTNVARRTHHHSPQAFVPMTWA